MGYSIELLNLLAQKIGLKINYTNGYTWTELLEMFKDKKIDLLHTVNKTPQRKTFGNFSDPYIRYKTYQFSTTGTIRIQQLPQKNNSSRRVNNIH